MYHSGWDVMYPEPGKVERSYCNACDEEMDVERNVECATGMAEAMAGRKHLCDRFTCPNAGQDWHNQLIALRQLIDRTPSRTLAGLVQAEVNEIMQRRQPTKHKWGI